MDKIKPQCIFLNTYYPGFLNSFYQRNPLLATAAYEEQKAALQSQFFGDSDFYSRGLINAGWEAEDLIINCGPLQQAWGKKNQLANASSQGLEIALAQIARKKPQVIYLQDLSLATKEFISAIRPYTSLIVGQIASPVPQQADLHSFDLIVSSFPHFVKRFRRMGIASYYQPLAFDPRILTRLSNTERKFDVTFMGGISPAHSERIELLEYLASQVEIDFWGYGANALPQTSPLKEHHHGELWGLEMFELLQSSKITVNSHLNVAENYANNMRLFEATGCGTLLITDYKDNLSELFEIGKEIVAYRSPDECAGLIKYYKKYPQEAAAIAHAGQARTLREHTYEKRMQQTAKVLSSMLEGDMSMVAPEKQASIPVSYGYSSINVTDVTPAMTNAWKDESIPEKQRELVEQELKQMYSGKVLPHYKALADILQPILTPDSSLLEIGCASGYYLEILQHLLKQKINYTGVDYSDPLISMAKKYYPQGKFFVADGANLFFSNRKFDVVISSCVLLHVPNYREHIFETVRVADKFVIAHRTPVCRQRPTQYFKKFAYGVETVELLFNEEEILREFTTNGLTLIHQIEYFSDPAQDLYLVTYLFKRS